MGKNVQFFFGKFCLKDNNSPPLIFAKISFLYLWWTYWKLVCGPIGNRSWTYRKPVRGPIGNRFVDLTETGLWT